VIKDIRLNNEYERLIKPIEYQMKRSVWRIIRNSDDVDDAFQDALFAIWKNLEKIRSHSNPHALILRICINSAYDFLRKKSRTRKQEEPDITSLAFPDNRTPADELLSNNEQRTEIFQAIIQLPHKQAVAALMWFIQELSYSEIAQALGCREETARKNVTRARNRLRKLLVHLVPNSTEEVKI